MAMNGSYDDSNNMNIELPDEDFDNNLNSLQEKRGSTREKALNGLINQMRFYYSLSYIEESKLTLMESLKRCLRKGPSPEKILATMVLSLTSITLGADSESLYKDFRPIIEETLRAASEDSVICSLLDSLAILCFVSNSDESDTIFLMERLFKEKFSDPSPLVRKVAIRGWTFLATSVTKNFVNENCTREMIPLMVSFLRDENVDVRLAAGECIALLFELARFEEETFDIQNYAGEIDIDEMNELLHQLSTEKARKKDKEKQKSNFREFTSSIQAGESPNETLNFKHQKFTFSTWSSIRQLDVLRECLGGGLQTHFEKNDLFQQIFSISVKKDIKKAPRSAVEKRMTKSPNSIESKARSKNMTKNRSEKSDTSPFAGE